MAYNDTPFAGGQDAAFLGGDAAGFTATPTQSGTPRDVKSSEHNQTVMPVTCKQVADVEKLSGQNMFKIGGKMVHRVCLVARLNGWKAGSGNENLMSVSDTTGTTVITIIGNVFLPELREWSSKAGRGDLDRSNFVRIHGHIREYHKTTTVIAFHCKFLAWSNSLVHLMHHYHLCVQTHLYNKHGPLEDNRPQQQGAAGAVAAPGVAAGGAQPGWGAQAAGAQQQRGGWNDRYADMQSRFQILVQVVRTNSPDGTMNIDQLKQRMQQVANFPTHEFSETLSAAHHDGKLVLEGHIVRV